MIPCPIKEKAALKKTIPAIFGDNFTLSYKELDKMIDQASVGEGVFYASIDLETIIQIFARLRKGLAICPISPRMPKLPNICLPQGQMTCLATSGTSLTPKYVLHSLSSHQISALNPLKELTLNEGDVWELSLPLNHIGGLAILFRTFFSGAAIALPSANKSLITHLSLVTTQLKRLLRIENPYPNLKALLLGGGPIPLDLCNDAASKELPLYLTYGMSEMASQIATKKFHPNDGVVFGHPLAQRELQISNHGEIQVRGATLFTSYLENTPSLINGFFATKDLGQMTNQGLIVLGRKDRMIISGGENIHLEEIETAALSLPEVIRVKAGQRSDDEFGTRPTIIIHATPPLVKDDLIAKLKNILPSFKVPYIEDILLLIDTNQDLLSQHFNSQKQTI